MFSMTCPHKDCHKFTDPVVDTTTDQIVCGDCFQPLPGLTNIVKTQLISMKRIKKGRQSGQAFSTKCPSCESNMVPELKNLPAPPKTPPTKALFCTNCNKDIKAPASLISLFSMRQTKQL